MGFFILKVSGGSSDGYNSSLLRIAKDDYPMLA